MDEIGRSAVAMNARRIGQEDADVVEHCAAVEEIGVQGQFGMGCGYALGMAGHLLAMVEQELAQRVVLGIVTIDEGERVNHKSEEGDFGVAGANKGERFPQTTKQ